jgi:hypothetical protein
MNQNVDHLKLLSVFHYIVAGLAALFSLFPTIHLAVGIAMVSGVMKDAKDPFPLALMGWLFIIFASCFILCGLTFATCLFMAGRYLQNRKRYTFCLVMAGIACMFMPFGTVLGVFTIVVLLKEDVKEMFNHSTSSENNESVL